jgi:hypothetical protein
MGEAVAARRVGIVKDQDEELGFLGQRLPQESSGEMLFACHRCSGLGEFAFVAENGDSGCALFAPCRRDGRRDLRRRASHSCRVNLLQKKAVCRSTVKMMLEPSKRN